MRVIRLADVQDKANMPPIKGMPTPERQVRYSRLPLLRAIFTIAGRKSKFATEIGHLS